MFNIVALVRSDRHDSAPGAADKRFRSRGPHRRPGREGLPEGAAVHDRALHVIVANAGPPEASIPPLLPSLMLPEDASAAPAPSLQEIHGVALETLARVRTLEAMFFVLNEHGPAELPAEETAEAYEGLVAMAREQLLRSLGHSEQAFALMLAQLGVAPAPPLDAVDAPTAPRMSRPAREADRPGADQVRRRKGPRS